MVKGRKRTIGIFITLLFVLQLTAISLPSVYSQGIGSRGADSEWGIFQPLSLIVDPIIHLFNESGSLSADQQAGIARFIIWIAVFAVVYQGLMVASGQNGWIKGNVAIALAFCFATISAIFMPREWVYQIGAGWAQAAFLLLLSPILLGIAAYAWSQRDNNPLISAAALFLLMGILFYYYTVFGVANPAGNTVAIAGVDFTGIIDIVVNYALLIVGILFLIQLFRGLSRMGGGGQGAGGGGIGGALGNIFGGGQGGNQPPEGQQQAQQAQQQAQNLQQNQQQQQQLNQQVQNLIQQMNQAQQQLNQMNQFIANQGAPITAPQIQNLINAIDHMIHLQTEYNQLIQQLNAAQHP